MNSFVNAIMRGVLDRIGTASDLARLPAAYRYAGGGVMSRIAAVGLLRLALRWPAFAIVIILAALAARVMSGRRHEQADAPRFPKHSERTPGRQAAT